MKMVERYTHLALAHKKKQVNNLNGKFTNCHLAKNCHKSLKMKAPQLNKLQGFKVAPPRIELGTHGFSVRRKVAKCIKNNITNNLRS